MESKGHAGGLRPGAGSKGGEAEAESARNKLWAALTVKRAPCFHCELKPLVTSLRVAKASTGVLTILCDDLIPPRARLRASRLHDLPSRASVPRASESSQAGAGKETLNGPLHPKAEASAPMPSSGASAQCGGQHTQKQERSFPPSCTHMPAHTCMPTSRHAHTFSSGQESPQRSRSLWLSLFPPETSASQPAGLSLEPSSETCSLVPTTPV